MGCPKMELIMPVIFDPLKVCPSHTMQVTLFEIVLMSLITHILDANLL